LGRAVSPCHILVLRGGERGYLLKGMEGELTIGVARGNGRCRLSLIGPLDIETAGELEAALEQACREGAREVMLDLRELTFLDSSGVASILRGQQLCERQGREYLLIPSTTNMLHRILLIAGAGGRLRFTQPADAPQP
jgi:anti-sigma B factor antagonist